MAASLAEAYMLILRPVPILGEAWAIPFNGQITLDSWDWKLTPEEDEPPEGEGEGGEETPAGPRAREDDSESPSRPELQRPPSFDGNGLIDEVTRMQRSRYAQPLRDRKVRELIQKAAAEHNNEQASTARGEGKDGAGAKANKGELTFGFTKTVDLSTSQMLYSLANNDLIPTIIITVFHRSSTSPVTLVITMVNVRFKSCSIKCDESEAMSEMTETWTGQYEHISYAYQNRPPVGIPASPFALLTQGRVKVFVMEPRGGGGLPGL